jgi:hypothetical protein
MGEYLENEFCGYYYSNTNSEHLLGRNGERIEELRGIIGKIGLQLCGVFLVNQKVNAKEVLKKELQGTGMKAFDFRTDGTKGKVIKKILPKVPIPKIDLDFYLIQNSILLQQQDSIQNTILTEVSRCIGNYNLSGNSSQSFNRLKESKIRIYQNRMQKEILQNQREIFRYALKEALIKTEEILFFKKKSIEISRKALKNLIDESKFTI